jgi:hypothetical protein
MPEKIAAASVGLSVQLFLSAKFLDVRPTAPRRVSHGQFVTTPDLLLKRHIAERCVISPIL